MKTTNVASGIKNIRYSLPAKISFDYEGNTFFISEPKDVILFGFDELAREWIAKNYGFLLVNSHGQYID